MGVGVGGQVDLAEGVAGEEDAADGGGGDVFHRHACMRLPIALTEQTVVSEEVAWVEGLDGCPVTLQRDLDDAELDEIEPAAEVWRHKLVVRYVHKLRSDTCTSYGHVR